MTKKTEDTISLALLKDNEGTIDRTAGTIQGAKIIELGDVKDARPFTVDQVTLRQVAELGNRPNKGIKARLSHPDGDGIGLHLGRWTNFRVDNNAVRADLVFAEAAKKSPHGDLVDYVLTLAEEDPESFGVSIAARLNMDEMEAADMFPSPLRVETLYSCDIVGEPAATNGLFNIQEVKDMSEQDEVVDVVEVNDVVEEVNDEVVEVNETEPVELQADHKPYVELFGDQGAVWFLEGKSLQDCLLSQYEKLSTEVVEQKEIIEKLSNQLESLRNSLGEDEPVSTDERQQLSAEQQAKVKRVKDLVDSGVSEKVAKWVSVFKVK